MSRLTALLVTLALATAMHLDWHAARPTVHHLSLGLSWHWLLAIPVFALTAWYVARVWPEHTLGASVAIIGIASVLAALAEPLYELWVDRAPMDWAFGPLRLTSFAAFLAAGIVTHVAVLALLRRRAPQAE